jgi:hypothetical protein
MILFSRFWGTRKPKASYLVAWKGYGPEVVGAQGKRRECARHSRGLLDATSRMASKAWSAQLAQYVVWAIQVHSVLRTTSLSRLAHLRYGSQVFCKVVKECFLCCLVRDVSVLVSFSRSGAKRSGPRLEHCDNCAWLSLIALAQVINNPGNRGVWRDLAFKLTQRIVVVVSTASCLNAVLDSDMVYTAKLSNSC